MPEELKTIKDLGWVDDTSEITFFELRKEAIKWIKEIKDANPETVNFYIAEDWIKHFFNIEESDLK